MRDNADNPGRRAASLAIAAAGIALLATACSGSPTAGKPAAGRSATHHQAVAFTRCMRTHGEPGWPAPSSQRNFNVSTIDITAPAYRQALATCVGLRPAGMKIQESASQRSEVSSRLRKFARCMRSHSIANFPDLTAGRHATPGGLGPDSSAPSFRTAMKACGAVSYRGGWWITGT